MEKKIKIFGLIPCGLLIAAEIIYLVHLPNYALLILSGILVFNLIELPIILFYLNRQKKTKRLYNISMFFTLFFFPLFFILILQDIFLPFKLAIVPAILTGGLILYFLIIEMKNKRIHIFQISYMHLYLFFIILLMINLPITLQAPDYNYISQKILPAYPKGKGPVIYFDEAHKNLHTLNDRLLVTGNLLESDGYKVKPLKSKISSDKILSNCKIFVINNALNDKNVDDWTNPTFSAFTEDEIENIKNWVEYGGSLLLIIDHMPIPGAAYNLAKKFGFELKNGHAMAQPEKDNYFFRVKKTLSDNIITNGRNNSERIDSILSFDGSGFIIPEDATSILTFDSTYYQWDPKSAWELSSVKPYSIKGFSQGAYKKFGKGKIVLYGEAMMFTAQLGAGLSWVKLGMNSEKCPNNYRLFLNTIHWLDGLIDK